MTNSRGLFFENGRHCNHRYGARFSVLVMPDIPRHLSPPPTRPASVAAGVGAGRLREEEARFRVGREIA